MSNLIRPLLAALFVALLVVPATAGAARPGRYKGNLYAFGSFKSIDKTGKVRLKVKHNKLVRFFLEDKNYRCIHNGFDPTDDTFEYFAAQLSRKVRIRNGELTKVYGGDDADDPWKITLKAKFRGKRARGSIDMVSYSSGCSKNWFWKAKLR